MAQYFLIGFVEFKARVLKDPKSNSSSNKYKPFISCKNQVLKTFLLLK